MVLEYYRANPQAYADVFKWEVTGPLPTTYSEPARTVELLEAASRSATKRRIVSVDELYAGE